MHPKWMFIVDTRVNSVHDKQKEFTQEYFEKFVKKFMRYIQK